MGGAKIRYYPGELKERRFGEGEGDLFKALQ